VVGFESLEPRHLVRPEQLLLRVLREGEIEVAVPIAHDLTRWRLRQLLEAVLPDRLEQLVTGVARLIVHDDERLVDEPSEQRDDVVAVHAVAGAHGLRRAKCPSPDEHRQSSEQGGLGL
jgi:hypothetical protein